MEMSILIYIDICKLFASNVCTVTLVGLYDCFSKSHQNTYPCPVRHTTSQNKTACKSLTGILETEELCLRDIVTGCTHCSEIYKQRNFGIWSCLSGTVRQYGSGYSGTFFVPYERMFQALSSSLPLRRYQGYLHNTKSSSSDFP